MFPLKPSANEQNLGELSSLEVWSQKLSVAKSKRRLDLSSCRELFIAYQPI